MKSNIYLAGFRLASEQPEKNVRKQLTPEFFNKMDEDWIRGYTDGIKKAYPHLLKTLLEVLHK